MERVTVSIPGRSYEVAIGSDLIERVGELLPDLPRAEQAFVVTDRVVADLAFPALERGLAERGLRPVLLAVPTGEQAKSLPVYETLMHQLATQEAHRDDVIVALGGGSVGDLAGFVASTYLRGVAFVQVPTTLTAQVDAAIGGKTAVDLPEGKNLVGSFFQPRLVVADVGVLSTLSDRDYRSGLAEVAKYALTLDVSLLEMLERDPGPVVERDPEVMSGVVARSVALKARMVEEDERDLGDRLMLNYGHTLGHALERLDSFAGRTHGEAIAIGMVFAARLSEIRGLSDAGLAARTIRLLKSLGLQTQGPLPGSTEIRAAFRMDKKYAAGVRFVLLEDVGRPVIVEGVPDEEIRKVLEEMGAGP